MPGKEGKHADASPNGTTSAPAPSAYSPSSGAGAVRGRWWMVVVGGLAAGLGGGVWGV